jgi:hypothetical protein
VFKEVCGCEILIPEIERHPALYECLLKEYSDKKGKVKVALVKPGR